MTAGVDGLIEEVDCWLATVAGSLVARGRIVRSTGRYGVDWLIKEVDYWLAIEAGSLVAWGRKVDQSTGR